MGKRGAQILLDRIGDREKEFPAEVVMEPELVVRESTCPAPARRRV
jgi:LacI family transcriptional regulator